MRVISIGKGEEVDLDDSKIKEFWLTSIVAEDDTQRVFEKPTYPSEFSIREPLRCNFNYDGMTPTIIFNPETKKLKASGWGYKVLNIVFN